jgi:O-antigen ligase
MEMAYHQWPWVASMGWPAAMIASTDPLAGFALTPELTEALRTASATLSAQPRPLTTPRPSPTLLIPVVLWFLAVPILFWRGWAAARTLPWRRWQSRWLTRPVWQQVGAWALLVLVYFVVSWPPVVLLCWIIAAIGFFAQPRVGLVLALFLLPFHAYHKEFDWLGQHWTIPPAHAALFCFLPTALYYRPLLPLRDRWLGVAASWAVIMALGATGIWYWPAFWGGMVDLVIIPLLLFLLIRAWATTRQESYVLILALAAGGLFQAGLGLIDWVLGGGTVVDGLRRLTGPAFTSNHIALYLIRTLALTAGLALAAHGAARWRWSVGSLATGIALLLTGSRGALLLGVPAGILVFLSQRTLSLPTGRRLAGWLTAGCLGLASLVWLGRERLANWGTMNARLEGWTVGFALWLHHLLFGVGPEGFWWTFPAYLSLTSEADPNLRHPHNLWLELATSGGLLALLWLLMVAWLLYRWVRSRPGALSWVQVGLLAGLVAGLAHAQMDAFQALPPLAGWNWAALALLLAYDQSV